MSNWYAAFIDGTEIDVEPYIFTLDEDRLTNLVNSGKGERLEDILDGMRVTDYRFGAGYGKHAKKFNHKTRR